MPEPLLRQDTENNFSLELAVQMKSRVVDAVKSIRRIAQEVEAGRAVDICDAALSEMQEELFRIVVVGEFNRGKSTFINAVLGRPVLPSGMRPVTTILNCIRYSDTLEYHLCYRTGVKSNVSAEEFLNIVAPAEPDPEDEEALRQWQSALDGFAQIEMAEIGCPAALCRNGVEIVDTPGTNDINPARERITYEFIPKADAILFMLSALDAIGESEIEFLKNRILKTDVQRVFFILNFADMLSSIVDRERVHPTKHEGVGI